MGCGVDSAFSQRRSTETSGFRQGRSFGAVVHGVLMSSAFSTNDSGHTKAALRRAQRRQGLAAEVGKRRHLEERVRSLEAELAALRGPSSGSEPMLTPSCASGASSCSLLKALQDTAPRCSVIWFGLAVQHLVAQLMRSSGCPTNGAAFLHRVYQAARRVDGLARGHAPLRSLNAQVGGVTVALALMPTR